ncbi:MAG: TerC family protein, partial [Wolbachia pipientis]|nr:TerC family protein [Wolbachia pipientis]
MFAETQTLLILTLFEIILNLDNLIFVSLFLDKTPNVLKEKIRLISLGLTLLMRFVTLSLISDILSIQKTIFHILSLNISVKDLLMIAGGLFLVIKSAIELWNNIFLSKQSKKKIYIKTQSFLVMLQITLIDLVFSVDSLLTAIVLTNNMITIAIAYILSTLVIISLSNYTAQLIKYSTNIKIIAILFILIVGMYLILEGLHIKLPKGYLYFSLI